MFIVLFLFFTFVSITSLYGLYYGIFCCCPDPENGAFVLNHRPVIIYLLHYCHCCIVSTFVLDEMRSESNARAKDSLRTILNESLERKFFFLSKFRLNLWIPMITPTTNNIHATISLKFK